MSPGPQGTSLGVDFGTSHTIAVVRRADGSLRPLLFDGAPLMPSAVCADADGGLLVGRDAVHAGRRHPERFEPNPKRLIDRPSTLLGVREFPIADLIAAVLHAVAEECRRVVGRPSQVTLTVPAEWGPGRRQVVEDAAARAGLGRVRLVPEPVAAATYYAESLKHRMAVGSSIVVYDLGAGTFDASVVRRTDDGFTTVALDGRSDLGGLDIDAALVEHLGRTYGDREGWKRLMRPTTLEERRHFLDFQGEIRGAKERLSRHQQSDFAIPLLGVEAHLTRTELEAVARPHLERTIEVTQAVIRAAGLDVAASAGVFLVGGASRMPLVATMLHRALGSAPTVLDQPEIVVAEGSVLWQAGSSEPALASQRTPQAAAFAAPLTPAAPVTPGPVSATPPTVGPLTPAEPQAPPYRPSPPEPHDATGRRPSPAQALPPQARPVPTPPRPQAAVGGDDADPPEPPLTEAERRRRKRIGTRAVVAIILVNALVIAGLAWHFGRDGGQGEEDFYDYVPPSLVLNWGANETGTLVAELTGAHEEAIASLTTVETDDGALLFSADAQGTIRSWSMDTGAMVQTYRVSAGVDSLHSTYGSDGSPIVVAVDHDYAAHVWRPSASTFEYAGMPELAERGDVGRLSVGTFMDAPTLGLTNDTRMELFDLESRTSHGVHAIPEHGGWAVFYTAEDELHSAVAVHPDHMLMDIDAESAQMLAPLEDTGQWPQDVRVGALKVLYQGGMPHAMVLGEDGILYCWDLSSYAPSLGPMPFDTDFAKFHDEIVDTAEGPSILFTDVDGGGWLKSFDTEETIPLSRNDAAAFTELGTVDVDGTRVAVTGDAAGNIQFWSLGL
ncbi:Hsp70 family protein [Glycomyces sp. TRM65418]|uniref:Hsp70 family protein n=1 Tax=Glycomyces sp. TRM65418 TaxID=2867006 RepID=UPI001CE6C97E|nr:Hsp70 family protein [Glycomyces sp. TRM65418]MCC3764031.1 Hsp70 family protein [Glycomyces sp. TRM65418]QZD53722.1 Hsp70 family protein [Glycomyces sp. TRM65418]